MNLPVDKLIDRRGDGSWPDECTTDESSTDLAATV